MGHYKGETGVSMNVHYITKEMRKKAGSGKYGLSKEERKEIKQRNKEHTATYKAHKEFLNTVHETTCELLSKELNTTVTMAAIKRCKSFRNIGNGRLKIKYVEGDEQPIIKVKRQKGSTYTFKVIK